MPVTRDDVMVSWSLIILMLFTSRLLLPELPWGFGVKKNKKKLNPTSETKYKRLREYEKFMT